MNQGFTSWDKAWLPLVVAGVGVSGYYGITSAEQTAWVTQAAPAVLAMIGQAVLVFWRKNK